MQQYSDILLVACGVVISGCLIAITALLAVTTIELRTTLRQLNALLPGADRALREIGRAFRLISRMFAAARHAAGRLDAVVRQACGVAEDALGRVQRLANRAGGFFGLYNGAGAEPRRVRRNGHVNRRREEG